MDDESEMAPRRWARRLERTCCRFVTCLPLLFVYGLTTWGAWVIVSIGSNPPADSCLGSTSSFIGIVLYLLLNWCYTTAVFTDPGSTTRSNGNYSSLEALPYATSFTVKSNGETRYCKKCQMRKPDRAHHCSTCRRCVLKMDHHCPWLATCIGLRNHKAFLLFLIYTTIFSIYACAISSTWTYIEIMRDVSTMESLVPVNYIILAVMSAIISLVIGAFTGWHIALAACGQTTIECLEKTRYSSLRDQIYNYHSDRQSGGRVSTPSYSQKIIDAHANAIPGFTRPEEGEDERGNNGSVGLDGQTPVFRSYEAREQYQSQKRYQEYLDEEDSRKLPNAFDLGWKRNFRHLFGPIIWLMPFPICNTIGDGWAWEANPKWLEARERMRLDREEQRRREIQAGWGGEEPIFAHQDGGLNISASPAHGITRPYVPSPTTPRGTGMTLGHGKKAQRPLSKADRILGRDPNQYSDDSPESISMSRLTPKGMTMEDLLNSDLDDDDLLEDEAAKLQALIPVSPQKPILAPKTKINLHKPAPPPLNHISSTALSTKSTTMLRSPHGLPSPTIVNKKPMTPTILGSRRWDSTAASGLLRKASPTASTGSGSGSGQSTSPFRKPLQDPPAPALTESSDDEID